MAALSLSVHFDWRLAPYDLLQTRAHAGVLRRAGLLTGDEHAAGRSRRSTRWRAGWPTGPSTPTPDDEDVHTAIERGLLELLGPDRRASCAPGAAATTRWPPTCGSTCATRPARSQRALVDLVEAIADQAEAHVDAVAPGFTHLQHAQPVSFGHELAKHAHALGRDLDRLADWDRRAGLSPLGAGALAGSALELDPHAVAAELGFDGADRQLHRRGHRP